MARFNYGMAPTDWVFFPGAANEAVLTPDIQVTFWNMQVGGVQYTDLLFNGVAADSIKSGNGTDWALGSIPRFQGPDGITSMWMDAGGGTRFLLVTTDLADLPARIEELETLVASLQDSIMNVVHGIKYDPGTDSYPAIPAAIAGQRYLLWIGPVSPADARAGDIHLDTVE